MDTPGLTKEEELIMDTLKALQNALGSLKPQHPLEQQEFRDAVHRIQGLMALRAARTAYPKYWPTYYQDPNGRWHQMK